MPFIKITVPSDVLDEHQRELIAEQMTVAIMKVETDGRDLPGFRAISALVFDLVEPKHWAIGGRLADGPAAIVDIRVPEGALSPERRQAMAEASYRILTTVSPALAAINGQRRIWTHMFEIVDWAGGGQVMTLDNVRTVAMDEHAVIPSV